MLNNSKKQRLFSKTAFSLLFCCILFYQCLCNVKAFECWEAMQKTVYELLCILLHTCAWRQAHQSVAITGAGALIKDFFQCIIRLQQKYVLYPSQNDAKFECFKTFALSKALPLIFREYRCSLQNSFTSFMSINKCQKCCRLVMLFDHVS